VAFRGYFLLNGREFANSSRVVSHLRPGEPVLGSSAPMVETPPGSGLFAPFGTVEDPPGSGLYTVPAGWVEGPVGLWTYVDAVSNAFCECTLSVPYDDSWSGLQQMISPGVPFQITNAPWYNSAVPVSAEFGGIWVMDVQGLDSTPIQREMSEMICAGGVAAPHRVTSKTVTFSALIVACTNAGAKFGLSWLTKMLQPATGQTGGELVYLAAHPDDTSETVTELTRLTYGMVLTKSPTITEVTGKGGGAQHRQSSVWRVEFELSAMNPFAWGQADPRPVVWDSVVEEAIEWVHEPDCTDPAACDNADMPVLFNADCRPATIDIVPAAAPVCGGCLPVCGIDRYTFTIDPSLNSTFYETAMTIAVTNQGTDPVTVNMFLRPCGSTDVCEHRFPLQIAGLPVGGTAVADSVSGRPYATVGGTRHRQVGIVTTPTGAPWEPVLIDPTDCWELVAEAAQDAVFSVELTFTGREL
jgi:hypothetical protein